MRTKNQRDKTPTPIAGYSIIHEKDYPPSFPTEEKWVTNYITVMTAKNQQGLVIDKKEILAHKTLKQKMLWEGVVKHLDTPPWTVLMAPGESAKPSDPVVGPTRTITEAVRLENTL